MSANKLSVAPSRASRALVVDDDKFMQVVLGDLLGDFGFSQVGVAANGALAIDAFDRAVQKPDVVLCDICMPASDGFQFMEQLAQRGFKGGVILVSGMNDRTVNSATLMARFHSLNILAALRKPVDEPALGAALARLV